MRQFGEKHHHWKGGRHESEGYLWVILRKEDPYYPMANKRGYVLEHRLLLAKHLGRYLKQTEIVHHIDGNKKNNNVENLAITSRQAHPFCYTLGYDEGVIAGIILVLPLIISNFEE